MNNNADIFIQHLSLITGRSEDVIRKVDSSAPKLPPVCVLTYKNWPEPGYITGFTFGLSTVEHPDWKYGKPELMISVQSLDEQWPLAIGYMAETLRGKCPFSYGNTINFHQQISDETKLNAFLVFGPPFLNKEQSSVKLDNFMCHIAGMYPMYSSEISLYEEIGLKDFWHLPDWDPFDIHRKPLKKPNIFAKFRFTGKG
jgi:hypothetical protein